MRLLKLSFQALVAQVQKTMDLIENRVKCMPRDDWKSVRLDNNLIFINRYSEQSNVNASESAEWLFKVTYWIISSEAKAG